MAEFKAFIKNSEKVTTELVKGSNRLYKNMNNFTIYLELWWYGLIYSIFIRKNIQICSF